MTNPIKYTSRSFLSIMSDINSDPELADKPEWWKRIWAGVGDVLAMYEDAVANNSYLRTAFTRQAVMDLLELIDYTMSGQQTSSGYLRFKTKASVGAKTFSKSVLSAALNSSINSSSLKFEAEADYVWNPAANKTYVFWQVSYFNASPGMTWQTGELIQLKKESLNLNLPTGLSENKDYYLIKAFDLVPQHYRLATSYNNAINGIYITFPDDGEDYSNAIKIEFDVLAQQKSTQSSFQSIGQSDGTTAWQTFDLPEENILNDTVLVTINSVAWTKVDTLVNSISTDRHFIVKNKSNNTAYIQFGNGTFGMIPSSFDVMVKYATGGGINSNVSSIGKSLIYTGGDSDITGVTNGTSFSGGSNPEGIESAKILGPLLLKATNRFVTASDGEVLALNYGGLAKAKVDRNFYGVGSCRLLYVPIGGGVLTSLQKTDLNTYLTNRTIMNSIGITITDPIYDSIAFTSALKVLPGYVYAIIKPIYEMAIKICLSARATEIISTYKNQGIETTVELINNIWSYTFDSTNYYQIQEILKVVIPPDFATDINEFDIIGVISRIEGIDYNTISIPASFPISFADGHISTEGVITTTEIV